jgi:hypothetical protein
MMNTYFIAGHARLPQGMAARNLYDTITITLELDHKYGVIVDASCTLATEHGINFLRNIIRGYCLADGLAPLLAQVKRYYRGKGTQAILAALKDANIQFELGLANNAEPLAEQHQQVVTADDTVLTAAHVEEEDLALHSVD